MPELPEVETVRDGLARWVLNRTVDSVAISHPRAVRRHLPGPDDLQLRLLGSRFEAAKRRGKYLWLPLEGRDEALVAHLGMSGQLLVQPPNAPDERHLHIRIGFADDGPELRFVDQRTFGGLHLEPLVPTPQGDQVPSVVAHIGRDPFDPHYDQAAVAARMRTKQSPIKRVLLDQNLVSGIGNIYADEALWRAQLHGERIASTLRPAAICDLLTQVREVMLQALRAGGTSFDALYVNVNGSSGYFDRSLNAYGRAGEPCPRCGTFIRRVAFMNRSSYFCPTCQRPPRARTTVRLTGI